jgi:hypothetical protein
MSEKFTPQKTGNEDNNPMRRTVSRTEIKLDESVLEVESCREDAKVSEQTLDSLFPDLDMEREVVDDILKGKRDRFEVSLDLKNIRQEERDATAKEAKLMEDKLKAIAAEVRDIIGDYTKAKIRQKGFERILKGEGAKNQKIRHESKENAAQIAKIIRRLKELKSDFEKTRLVLRSKNKSSKVLNSSEMDWLADFFIQNKKLLKGS